MDDDDEDEEMEEYSDEQYRDGRRIDFRCKWW